MMLVATQVVLPERLFGFGLALLILSACAGTPTITSIQSPAPLAASETSIPTPTSTATTLPPTLTPTATTLADFAWCPLPDDPPQPDPGILRFVYLEDGDLWAWDYGLTDPYPLTVSGDVTSFTLSPDGRQAAIIRDSETTWPELWVVNTDTAGLARLITRDDVLRLDPRFEQAPDYSIGVTWVPGGDQLRVVFGADMTPEDTGIGCNCISSQPRLMDVATGAIGAVAPSGLYSPNGQWVLDLQYDTKMRLYRADGALQWDNVVPEPAIVGYGEYTVSSPIVWADDSQSFTVVTNNPDPDTEYSGENRLTVWRVTVDGEATAQGTVRGHFPSAHLSPDGAFVVYERFDPVDPSDADQFVASVVGEEIWFRHGSIGGVYWSPGPRYFAYTDRGEAWLGDVCGNSRPLIINPPPPQGPVFISWIDPTRFVYTLVRTAGDTVAGNTFYLGTFDGELELLSETWDQFMVVVMP